MAASDVSGPRLFLNRDLAPGAQLDLDRGQANYLLSVLRLGPGAELLIFNGRDGEWRARLAASGRRSAGLEVVSQVRAQTRPADIHLLFAPLKHARLDYLVQKAVEMGAGALRPVLTRRTVATRINRERMEANIVEAAEQCGILSVPGLLPEASLPEAVAAIEDDRRLVFCDEEAPQADPLAALRAAPDGRGAALLIGPEGGFDGSERALLLARPSTVRLSLGPRILRADTAAVAALALVQAVLGDWPRAGRVAGSEPPPYEAPP